MSCHPRHQEPLKLLRKSLGIRVAGGNCPRPITGVDDPLLPAPFRKTFEEDQRLSHPTPVQSQCWSAILNGSDAIVIAPTGTGKTLAYLLPAVCHLLGNQMDGDQQQPRQQQQSQRQHQRQHEAQQSRKVKKLLASSLVASPGAGPSVIVLVPTRELAAQVGRVSLPFRRLFGLRTVVLYGGEGRREQVTFLEEQCHAMFASFNSELPWSLRLRRLLFGSQVTSLEDHVTHMVVATPGRLVDLALTTAALPLHTVTMLILDEADRMVSLGFHDELSAIASRIRPDRQTIMLSATFPQPLQSAAALWMPTLSSIQTISNSTTTGSKSPSDAGLRAVDGASVAEEQGTSVLTIRVSSVEMQGFDTLAETTKASASEPVPLLTSSETDLSLSATRVFDRAAADGHSKKSSSSSLSSSSMTLSRTVTHTFADCETEEDKDAEIINYLMDCTEAVRTQKKSKPSKSFMALKAATTAAKGARAGAAAVVGKMDGKRGKAGKVGSSGTFSAQKCDASLSTVPAPTSGSAGMAAEQRRQEAALVFCNRIDTVKKVVATLAQAGIRCAPLHGKLRQTERLQAVNDLMSGRQLVVVATDVAARGR